MFMHSPLLYVVIDRLSWVLDQELAHSVISKRVLFSSPGICGKGGMDEIPSKYEALCFLGVLETVRIMAGFACAEGSLEAVPILALNDTS